MKKDSYLNFLEKQTKKFNLEELNWENNSSNTIDKDEDVDKIIKLQRVLKKKTENRLRMNDLL